MPDAKNATNVKNAKKAKKAKNAKTQVLSQRAGHKRGVGGVPPLGVFN